MLMGNKPEKVTPTMVLESFERSKHEFEKFGLFETATPNYTTYYPDVTPEDLKPSEGDFIYPIFRALSATTVWKGFKPIDFSKPGVLKAAMNLLVGQTINADHETALGNAMGTVRSVFWQEETTKNGTKIPPGINAEFMIDGKSNPRIARGIQMNPPSIHSNSVSVRFAWEPSHKMKNDEDFYAKLGTRDEKGNFYRLVVTEVMQFSETSLVSHGADAFAQKIGDDGMIVNPTYAAGVYTFSDKDKENKGIGFSAVLDYKDEATFSLSAIPENLNNNNPEKPKKMDVIEILEKALNLEAGTVTEENLTAKVSEVLTSAKEAAIAQKETEVEKLKGEKIELETKLQAAKLFEDNAKKFEIRLTEERTAAVATYKKLKGDTADPAIVTMIENQDFESVKALHKSYQSDLEAKFPTKCTSCGKTQLSRGSANPEEGEEEFAGTGKVRTNAEARAFLQKKKREQK
jgi:hypothetical protein